MHYGHQMSLSKLMQITKREIVRGSRAGKFGFWEMHPNEVPYFLGRTLDLAAARLGVVCDERGIWREAVEGAKGEADSRGR
jgi:hypothetical protein